MTGLGTLVNMAAILIGSGIGLLLKNGIPKRLQTTISSAVGLCVVFVGVTGAIKGLMNVSGTTFETKDTLVVVICMAIGAAIGECLDLEQRMENLGDWVKSKLPNGSSSSNFTEAFVSTSLVFCIGAMAIVGSIEDGLNHDYTMLFTKAVMDGVLSIVFVASLGIGAAFAMFPVGIYQGSITLLAGLVKPYLTDLMIGRLSCIVILHPYLCPWFKSDHRNKDQDRKYASGCIPAGYRMPVGDFFKTGYGCHCEYDCMKGHYHVKRRKTDLDLLNKLHTPKGSSSQPLQSGFRRCTPYAVT